MSKSALILGVAGAVVVIACGAGGAIYALNASNSDNASNKTAINYELQKEQTKLNGWQQKGDDWYYYKDNSVQTGWVQDNGWWYYLEDSGKMKLNWVQDKNKWYCLGSDGKLRTGWIKDNDNWYYMNSDGTMAVNTTVDGNYLNANGLIEETPKPKAQQSVNDTVLKDDNIMSKKVIGKWKDESNNQIITITNVTDFWSIYSFFKGDSYKKIEDNTNRVVYDFNTGEYQVSIAMVDSNKMEMRTKSSPAGWVLQHTYTKVS